VKARGEKRRRPYRGVVTPETINERWVDLDGAANVRDLGGLEVAGGGRTARGVLLRADNLQDLTAGDVERLVDDLGVRVVIDLRTDVELHLEGPGPLAGDDRVDVRHRSLLPETADPTKAAEDGVLPWHGRALRGDPNDSPAVRAYLGYLRDRPESIVGALADVAHADGGVVVHCAAGKDRTGVVSALALSAVGVPRRVVIDDYVATGERLGALLARLRGSSTYADDIRGRPDESHRPRPETMARVLDVLDASHGGVRGWLGQHGFCDADLDALRARLVA
jgi:protein-tyrosine phosphatase